MMTKETNHRKRQGSPWKGLWAVIGKEMSDHLTSARMQILEVLIVLTAVGTGYTALQQISSSTNDQFLFLSLLQKGCALFESGASRVIFMLF
jgi:ABC-2 type transport system permease protein